MAIEFDTDQTQQQYQSRVVLGQPQTPKMAEWMAKKGIIKDEAQGGLMLVGIVVFNIIVTGLVIYYFFIR